MPRTQALLLVGHGSHHSPEASAPVYAHGATLRAGGAFDEVAEAFWKGEPGLGDALSLVESDDIYIVPLFVAEGYFTRQVVPRELGLAGDRTRRGAQQIRYCPPVGTHPSMGRMILERALGTCGLSSAARRDAALVVIGHGTGRSTTSGGTLYRLMAQLRHQREFGRVACGFLDEEPTITRVLERIRCCYVVLVPFFVAEGWHTRTTIPSDLGLAGERTERDGRVLWYTPPVGTLPELAAVAAALAQDAGARPRAAGYV